MQFNQRLNLFVAPLMQHPVGFQTLWYTHWWLESCTALKNVPPISRWAALSASAQRPTVSWSCSRMLNWSWHCFWQQHSLGHQHKLPGLHNQHVVILPSHCHQKPIIWHPKWASEDDNGNKWMYKTPDLLCGSSSKSSGPQWQLRVAHLTQRRRSRSHL